MWGDKGNPQHQESNQSTEYLTVKSQCGQLTFTSQFEPTQAFTNQKQNQIHKVYFIVNWNEDQNMNVRLKLNETTGPYFLSLEYLVYV